MVKDANESMTVPQLKELLKSKGLPTSGKKSELILRLYANKKPKQIKIKSGNLKKARLANSEDTPYLSALLKGGLGAVDIDGWKAAKFGMATIMVFLIFTSLGSYSWYNLENEEVDDDYTQSISINYGLNDFEVTTTYTFYMGQSQTEKYEYSEFEEVASEETAKLVGVNEMSTSGLILQICLYLSLLVIITLLVLEILRGSGSINSGFVEEQYQRFGSVGWGFSVIIILSSLFIHLIITSSIDHGDLFDGEYTAGLGSMWWLMLIFTSLFATIVFNNQTMQIIGLIKSKLND
tara:strand:+ start:9926 stop:10804 length:879 start_codon:yes stop_codon:yes gene_type:complete